MPKQVVILGGGPAGVNIAHKILKRSLPTLADLKVILVSPNTHTYWPVGAVRGVIPGEFADDILFHPIQAGFAKYKPDNFEFLEGKATALDVAANSVQVETPPAASRPCPTTSSSSPPAPAPPLVCLKVGAAKTIVVAGGGPAGVETAGEIAAKYGAEKKVTLVVAADALLKGWKPAVGQAAEANLKSLGVTVIKGARATTAFENNGAVGEVALSNGETIATDLFIPSSASLAQDKSLRVSGTKNVWAVGDVGSLETKQQLRIDPQVASLWKNVDAALRDPAAVPSDHKLFSWFASMVKGKTLFTEHSAAYMNGGKA
ncbi:unnamed protein product [Parascedosporium putredinis]|uniref:FAD/NAD(P)-binding domain-containing protein n=1 Tax=Parascedosporium putredinis TaxID=1442378 RepID=A0A9P1MD21_9PEZI|nr:unnamed protein product [Parascedosporium putredinis]CAI7999560.1 unnamed protein product [Parascedosporium putredinis]